jgi:hypothetical protein
MRHRPYPVPASSLTLGFPLWLAAASQILFAHEGHQAATYQVTAAAANVEKGKHLRLKVFDAKSSRAIAARFTLTVNSSGYIPPNIDRHGLRFVSIHQRRKQRFIATYTRGTGDVLIPLPNDARSGTVTVAKDFEFIPVTVSFDIAGPSETVEVRLARWIDLQAEGWHAADEHLHYERTDPGHDGDWLTMLDADGLTFAHFLVLKGGNLPGIWAQQFAYGKAGEATDGIRLIRPGEEYRDQAQGHVNLLGVEKVIAPISTGGVGEPRNSFNYPPLLDVFRRMHELGGIGGPAHGGSLARSSTAVLDTVLGQVDFFEIANTHLYKTDVWYRLLNCGFIVPPVAGTDLPNFGFRDPWQPLLGEVRTYVRSGVRNDFKAWKQAVRRGEVFVTSGPVIRLDVHGAGPGQVVRLPPQGGKITVTAEVASPRPLSTLEVVSMGQPLSIEVKRTHANGIHRLQGKKEVTITKSCWLAARAIGGPKTAIEQGLKIKQDVMAHTGVVQILVGNQPIRSQADIEKVRTQLVMQQEYYRTQASYRKSEHRLRFVDLFEQAINRLGIEPHEIGM